MIEEVAAIDAMAAGAEKADAGKRARDRRRISHRLKPGSWPRYPDAGWVVFNRSIRAVRIYLRPPTGSGLTVDRYD